MGILGRLYTHIWSCYFCDNTGIYTYRKGKPKNQETEEKKMNKQEIAKIIESKAAEYGLKLQENTMGWANESNHDSYIRIEVRKERDYDKTDWEARKVFWDIKANAGICQMGGDPTPEELLKAADEIARGARFTAAINSMELSCIENF